MTPAVEALLLGRVAEKRRLCALVDHVVGGKSGAILLVGEAGIGKSALAVLAGGLAEVAGARTAIGHGVPLTIEQPLQPVLAALDRLGAALGGHGRTLIEATVGDAVSLLLQRALDQVDAVAAEGPLVLLLEDLHWADRATLTMVHHLATRASGGPIGVVATARPTGPGSPLRHLMASLGDDVIELGGLDASDVDELAARRLGRPPGPSLQSLLAGGGGNPMLAEALLDGLISTGGVGDDPAQAELIDAPVFAVGGPVVAQIEALAPPVLHLVQLASLVAGPVRVDLLSAITTRGPVAVLDDLEAAVTGGVLRRRGGELAFRHDLHRAAAAATLPETGQAALHLEIARAMDTLGASNLEIAEHIARGARPGNRDAVKRLTATADEVVGRDPATALRVSELALGLVGQPDVPAELQIVRVAALAACGQAAEADLLGRALLRTSLTVPIEARVRRDLALAAFVDGRSSQAVEHMTRAVAIAPDEVAAAMAHTELAWAQFLSLDHASAIAGAKRGVAEGDGGARIAALSLLCWIGLWRLDTAMATDSAEALEALVAVEPRDQWHVFQPLLGVAAVHLEHGRLERSRSAVARGRLLATEAGSAWAAAAYDAMAAGIDLREGDLDAAREHATTALEGTAVVDGFGVEVWSRGQLAHLAIARGDLATAEHHVQAGQMAAADGRAQLGLELLMTAEAGLAFQRGDSAKALAVLSGTWDLCGAMGVLYVRGSIGVAMLQSAAAGGDQSRSEEVVAALTDAARSEMPGLVIYGARAAAWHQRTPAAVGDAVDAARATGWPLTLWETLRDGAAILATVDTAAASRLTAEASALGARLGLAADANRSAAGGRPVPRPSFGPGSLTEAEQRVAELVTEGLTNAQIAARLIVSRRTIDTQVLAAYRKLGVNSRVELTRMLLLEA